MINIERRKLPNGSIPTPIDMDRNIKEIVMKLNENILSLSKQLDTLQRAVQELQKEVRR